MKYFSFFSPLSSERELRVPYAYMYYGGKGIAFPIAPVVISLFSVSIISLYNTCRVKNYHAVYVIASDESGTMPRYLCNSKISEFVPILNLRRGKIFQTMSGNCFKIKQAQFFSGGKLWNKNFFSALDLTELFACLNKQPLLQDPLKKATFF